jgi:hypothetical protein
MGREFYRCTYCSQTSSRKWNLNIHIQRRHKGMKNPFESSSGPHSHMPKLASSIDKLSSYNDHPFSPGHQNGGNRVAFTNNSDHFHFKGSSDLTDSSSPKKSDPRSSLEEELRQATEIKRMINQIKPSTNQPSALDLSSLLTIPMLFRNASDPTIFLFLKVVNENKNVGFRGRVCDNCFTCWADPVYSNDGEMKSLLYTKPTLHTCDPKKAVEAQKVQNAETKRNKLENQMLTLLLSLTSICMMPKFKKPYLEAKELIHPPNYAIDLLRNPSNNYPQEEVDTMQQESYPKCWIEGEEVNCNPVNIGLANVDEKHWAYRSISECLKSGESSLEIDNNELMDFFKTAKGTFGILSTDIGESIRHFFMHVSFRNDNGNLDIEIKI